MKPLHPILFLSLIATLLCGQGDIPASSIPAMPPERLFLRMAERSPFSNQSGLAEEADHALGWYLSGLLNIADKEYAILKNLETGEQVYLSIGIPTHGFQLQSVQRDPDPHRESITLLVNQRQIQIGYHPDFIQSRISRFRHLPDFHQQTEAPSPSETP